MAVAPVEPALADGFTSTGSLAINNDGRYGASDALLPDGRVLIAGGFNSSGNVASAVVWDPGTGQFTVTANSFSVARGFATASTLTSTKALFADGGNGTDQDGTYANSDLYDPSTGMFSAGPSTNLPRHNPTATLLGDGKVLVAGGIVGGAPTYTRTATAELYDPAANSFAYTGSMHAARDFHVAALLPNGNVLIAGGGDGSGVSLNSAEIYNTSGASAGTFTLLANTMVERRDDATATLLPSGKVLIVGGVNQDVPSGTAELFDYTTNTFTAVPSTITPRHFHTATLLKDGTVLIAGGLDAATDAQQALTDVQIYNPVSNSFSSTGPLHVARFYHTATLLSDGRVLVAGGYSNTGVTATAEVYGALADEIFGNGFD